MRDMLGRKGVMPRKKAQEVFLQGLRIPKGSQEEIDVVSSLGRIVSREICSPEDLPAFPRSTMDGYAVRAQETYGATEALPAYLTIVGEVPMGAPASIQVRTQEAVRIATGGMMPGGADAVVMFEHTSEVDERMIQVYRPVVPGENVIQKGEDFPQERAICGVGHRIRPQDVGALCGVGVTKIQVYKRPKVAVIPTGNEIIPPDQAPELGQVRDINSYYLSALVEQMCAVPVVSAIVPDEEARLKETILKAMAECDLVLLSGGSSVGTRDLTANVISDLGNPGIVVHGVAMKPGKPTLCAHVGEKAVIGLPGHPAAVAISFDLFVRPVIRILSGQPAFSTEERRRRTVPARLSRNVASRPGREDYIRVALDRQQGVLTARPILGKSGLISTFIDAAGTVVVAENDLGIEKGAEVQVRLF